MKSKFIHLFAFLQTFFLYSQTIKTYSGNYENGIATYQYYENADLERVMQGSYLYKYGQYSFIGIFKEGKKHGNWKIIRNNDNKYSTECCFKEVVTVNFNMDSLNGNALYVKTDNRTGKVLSKSVANFKNNIIVGKYSYFDIEFGESYNIKFDDFGYLDGNNQINYIEDKKNYEHIIKSKEGFIVYEMKREKSTGSVNLIDRSNFIKQLLANYNSSLGASFIPEVKFKKKNDQDLYSMLLESGITPTEKGDTVIFRNVTFKINTLTNTWSYFGSHYGLNFWYNSTSIIYNPLFKFSEENSIKTYSPIRLFSVDKNAYDKYLIDSKNILQKTLLDSLKNSLIKSIKWINIEKNSSSFQISSFPVSKRMYSIYKIYHNYPKLEYLDEYNSGLSEYEFTERISEINYFISNSSRDFDFNYVSGGRFGGSDYRFNDDYANVNNGVITEIADFLGYKVATEEQVELATDKINPDTKLLEYLVK